MPSASVRTATNAKPGLFARVRQPYRKSWNNDDTRDLLEFILRRLRGVGSCPPRLGRLADHAATRHDIQRRNRRTRRDTIEQSGRTGWAFAFQAGVSQSDTLLAPAMLHC